MPARHVIVRQDVPAPLVEGLEHLRDSLDIPGEFSAEVLAAAEQAAGAPRLPQADRTDLAFVTIDPEGSKDLDQALFITRDGDGYIVYYAIADVAAFVTAGDPVDAEAHRRGVTYYAPSHRTPLHPQVLSEGAASLLPDQVRPALLWELKLDAAGKNYASEVSRALVRSREQLTYEGVQRALDDGSASEVLVLLKEVGLLREQREKARGGVSLPIPEQEVVATGDQWELAFRSPLPVEGWNAQISLMTGMAAAHMMLYAQVGILRTLPPADQGSLRKLRTTAKALGIVWPAEMGYPEFVRSLDPNNTVHAVMLNACTMLFRGAGYTAFSGSIPEHVEHAALAVEYAHCTAPLRRLVDRYVGEICVAICAGTPVPEWVTRELEGLAETMVEADRRAKKFERGVVDLVEALVLSPHVGQEFTGTVLELDERDRDEGRILLADPAVEAPVRGRGLTLGHEITATLTSADMKRGTVTFKVR